MRLSLPWIARCLGLPRLPVGVAELRERLTRCTAEIGAATRSGPALEGVVVGRVLTVAPHPNADRLRTTTVDVGGRTIPVVCGAPNVAVGQTVAVALPGAQVTVPGKDGQPTRIAIKAGKLRGEPSDGMLCAADELGLPGGHEGILVLAEGPAPGTPLADILGGEVTVEVENIAVTHRSDLWGHLGWAREVAAVLGLPAPAEVATAVAPDSGSLAVAIEDPGCTTYLAAVVEGVGDGPSPEWMVRSLEAVGCRSLGRLVDATNWVMFELGHPLHAFDAAALPARRIAVRAGREEESFAGLDGREHALAAGDLVIGDAADGRALALAGIIGGRASGVGPATTALVLEAAVFAPTRIRRTRQRLGIATDAAARFEKGLQPEGAAAALQRLIALYQELCPGCQVTARASAGATAAPLTVVPFDPHAPGRLAGAAIPADEAVAILARLGLVSESGGQRVPWWRRRDLVGAHDLCEEVCRLHGYERIAPAAPRLPMRAPAAFPLRELEHRVRQAASALGWDDVASYAFTSDAWADALGWAEGTRLRIAHPLSSEHTLLRQSLLPGLAAAAAANRKQFAQVRLIEVGRRYARGIGAGDIPDERETLAGIAAAAGDEQPFYAAREGALGILAALGIEARVAPTGEHPGLVPGRSAALLGARGPLGVVGELPGAMRRLAGLEDRAAWFELDLAEVLAALPARPAQHRPPSRFPLVTRDFTFVAPTTLAYAELAAACRQGAGDTFAGVELVGLWQGEGLPSGHHAVSLRVSLQADDRTLGERELAQASERIVATVAKRTGARLRG